MYLQKTQSLFLLNGTSVPSFLSMVWACTADVCMIYDVVNT